LYKQILQNCKSCYIFVGVLIVKILINQQLDAGMDLALSALQQKFAGGVGMKKVKKWTIVMILVMSMFFLSYKAMASEVKASVSTGVFSAYVWRGQKLSNSYVVQPSVEVSYGGFNFNFWSNIDSDYNDEFEHTETDLTLEYDHNVDRFNISAGYIYYALDSVQDTQEVYLSIGYDIIFTPTLTIYYDFEEGDGGFVTFSVSHPIQMKKILLNLGASVSYNLNNRLMGTDKNGDEFSNFYNGEFSASLSIPVSNTVSIEPSIGYSFPLSNDAEDALHAINDDADKDVLYGGLTVILSF